jgi:hypothetical protein
MKNECGAKKWLVIELSQVGAAPSTPKAFTQSSDVPLFPPICPAAVLHAPAQHGQRLVLAGAGERAQPAERACCARPASVPDPNP